MDYQKITLRGTISEKAKWHRRKYRSQSFTTFEVTINSKGKKTTFPIIAYGHAAVSAGMNFRKHLRGLMRKGLADKRKMVRRVKITAKDPPCWKITLAV